MSIAPHTLPARYQNQIAAQLDAANRAAYPQLTTAKPQDATIAFFVAAGLPAPVAEHRFHVERKWRFDYAWPVLKIALEVEGGVWTNGRHTRGAGFLKDCEKYNAAAVMGWRVLRVTPATLRTADTCEMLRRACT
jgi:hypothetical protein